MDSTATNSSDVINEVDNTNNKENTAPDAPSEVKVASEAVSPQQQQPLNAEGSQQRSQGIPSEGLSPASPAAAGGGRTAASIVQEALRYLSPSHFVSSRALLTTGNPFVSATSYQTGESGAHVDPYAHGHSYGSGGAGENVPAPVAGDLSTLYRHEGPTADEFFVSPRRAARHINNGERDEAEEGGGGGRVPYSASVIAASAAHPSLSLLAMVQGEVFQQRHQAAYYASLLESSSDEEEEDKEGYEGRHGMRRKGPKKESRHSHEMRLYGELALRATAIARTLRSACRHEHAERIDAINAHLYRREMAHKARRAETVEAVRQQRAAAEAQECTFTPKISEHAMNKKKQRGGQALEPTAFYTGGNQWVADKNKRLAGKIKKLRDEQAEADAETYKPWAMNKASVQILENKKAALAEAEAAGVVRRGTLAALQEWQKMHPAAKHPFPKASDLENVLVKKPKKSGDDEEFEEEDDDDDLFDPSDPLEAVVAAHDSALGNMYGFYDAAAAEIVETIREERRQKAEVNGTFLGLEDEDDENDLLLNVDDHIKRLINEDQTIDAPTRRRLLARHASSARSRKVNALERFIRRDDRNANANGLSNKVPYWAEECHFHPAISAKSAAMAEDRWVLLNDERSEGDAAAHTRLDVATRLSMDAENRRQRHAERVRRRDEEEAAEMERLSYVGLNGGGERRRKRTPEEAEAYARRLMSGETTSDTLRARRQEEAEAIKAKWERERAEAQQAKVIRDLLSTEAQLTFLLEAAEDPDCDLLELAKSLPGATNRKGTAAAATAAQKGGPRGGKNASLMNATAHSQSMAGTLNASAIPADTLDETTLLTSLTPRGLRLRSTPKQSVVPLYAAAPDPTPDATAPPPSANVKGANAGSISAAAAKRMGASADLAAVPSAIVSSSAITAPAIRRDLTPTVAPLASSSHDYRLASPRYLRAVEERYGDARFAPASADLNAYHGSAAEAEHMAAAAAHRSKRNQKGREAIAAEAADESLRLLRTERLSRETQRNQLQRLEAYEAKRAHSAAALRREREAMVEAECTFRPSVNPKSAQLVSDQSGGGGGAWHSTAGAYGTARDIAAERELAQLRAAEAAAVAEDAAKKKAKKMAGGANSPIRRGGSSAPSPSRIDNRNTMTADRGFSPMRSSIARGLDYDPNAYNNTNNNNDNNNRSIPRKANGGGGVQRGLGTDQQQQQPARVGPSARWSSPATRERYAKEASTAVGDASRHQQQHSPRRPDVSPIPMQHRLLNSDTQNNKWGYPKGHDDSLIAASPAPPFSADGALREATTVTPQRQQPLRAGSAARAFPSTADTNRNFASVVDATSSAVMSSRAEAADARLQRLRDSRSNSAVPLGARGGVEYHGPAHPPSNTASSAVAAESFSGNATNAAFVRIVRGAEHSYRQNQQQREHQQQQRKHVSSGGDHRPNHLSSGTIKATPPVVSASREAADIIDYHAGRGGTSEKGCLSEGGIDVEDDLDAEIDRLVNGLTRETERQPQQKQQPSSTLPTAATATATSAVNRTHALRPTANNSHANTSATGRVAPTVTSNSHANSAPPPAQQQHRSPVALFVSKAEIADATRIVANSGMVGDGGEDGEDVEGEGATALVGDLLEWFRHLVSLRLLSVPLFVGGAPSVSASLASTSAAKSGGGGGGQYSADGLRMLLRCTAAPSSPESSLSPHRRRVPDSSSSPTRHHTSSSSFPHSAAHQHRFDGTFASFVEQYGDDDLSLYGTGRVSAVSPHAAVVSLEIGHAALVVAMRVEEEAATKAANTQFGEYDDDDGNECDDVSDADLLSAYIAASSSSSAARKGVPPTAGSNTVAAMTLPDARLLFPRGALTFSDFTELFVKMYGLG